jgi:predicted phage tail protein
MNARPVGEVADDAAKLLGDAVAAVTSQALKPTLQPFKTQAVELAKRLEDGAGTLDQIARDQNQVLGVLNAQLASAVKAAASQQEAFGQAVEAIAAIGGDIGRAAEQAAARQQTAAQTVVAAITQAAADFGAATRDLAELTRQLAAFRRRLAVSVGAGALGFVAGAIALILSLR